MKIIAFPLTRITVFFILGILAFRLYRPEPVLLYSALSLTIAFLVLLHFLNKRNQKLRKVFGILVLLCSFLTGGSTAMVHKETFYVSHYTNQIKDFEKPHLLEIIVQDKLKATKKYSRYNAQVISIDNINSSGKIILNLKKSNTDNSIASGTKIRIYEPVYQNRYPFNPNQFDYGRYLENQEIYAQVYTDANRVKTIGQTESITSLFSVFRTKIIDNLKLSDIKQEELHVLVALLLGQQQDLSPEIVKDYQFAGAVHILSVSGLHVGFILLFVTFILNVFPNTRRHSLLKLFIILLSLWAFGFIAGLSSTVVRSATMFSFVAIGNHIRKSVNVFHTLLVSLLLILLFRPSFLYDIGFQLSYLALFFILWLQPVLSGYWQPKNKIIRYFWDITTVSFAAQIGTLPLSIYYFHQFPGLFFITNLIVLPLVGVIMVAGVLCIIFAGFSIVPEIVIQPTEFLITLLNSLIHQVASLENFVIKNIPFTSGMFLMTK
ncbi:MAG: ComEC/Rec2 family competence protein, partial [Flavobacterium sp.]